MAGATKLIATAIAKPLSTIVSKAMRYSSTGARSGFYEPKIEIAHRNRRVGIGSKPQTFNDWIKLTCEQSTTTRFSSSISMLMLVHGPHVDYPDSKKIAGVKNADFKTATYVGLGRLAPTDYYVGEDD
jgi:hypothetical protein